MAPAKNLEYAEMAMKAEKVFDRTVVCLYDEDLKQRAEEEQTTRESLLEMLELEGFYMLYQPQVNLMNEKVHGFEALVRAKERGMFPGKFIPVAEANGLIWKIGRVTTELVIRQLAAWRDAGKEVHPVSINFSSMQLSDEGFLDFLKGLMEQYRIPASLVELEITESIFVGDTTQAILKIISPFFLRFFLTLRREYRIILKLITESFFYPNSYGEVA